MTASPLEFTIRNQNPDSMHVIIEPWAEEFSVPSKSSLTFQISCEENGTLESEVNSKYFVVCLWKGCRVKAILDGKDVTLPSLSIPVPG